MKTCFICPIYDKGNDFKYALEFLESKYKNTVKADLYFVFSNKEQKDKFCLMMQERGYSAGSIVIPDNLSVYNNPIVVKKLYAMEMLYKQYEYLVPVDCECMFIKSFDVDKTMEQIWNSNSMLTGNLSYVGKEILTKCATYMGLENNDVLKCEFNDFSYNIWFNEIPVYKADTLRDFYKWLDENNYREIVYENWDCFDYYAYAFFLILKENYHINKHNIVSISAVMEEINLMKSIKRRHKIEKILGTHWTPNLQFYDNDKIVMHFHLDRGEGDEKYVSASHYSRMVFRATLIFKHPHIFKMLKIIKGWCKNEES